MSAGQQHALEFGGSPVGTEFDGSLSFRQIDRIPIFTLSAAFTPHAARQIRYGLVSTWGPERPFYQRYQWVVIDVRMVTAWQEGSSRFVEQLRDRLRELGGELVLVSDQGHLPPGMTVVGTVDAAVEWVSEARKSARSAALHG